MTRTRSVPTAAVTRRSRTQVGWCSHSASGSRVTAARRGKSKSRAAKAGGGKSHGAGAGERPQPTDAPDSHAVGRSADGPDVVNDSFMSPDDWNESFTTATEPV